MLKDAASIYEALKIEVLNLREMPPFCDLNDTDL